VTSIIQYTVDVLGVKDIIVAGHTKCGGIAASLTTFNFGPLEHYLSRLRKIRANYADNFIGAKNIKEETEILVQINVREQVLNVASIPFVQNAWKKGQ